MKKIFIILLVSLSLVACNDYRSTKHKICDEILYQRRNTYTYDTQEKIRLDSLFLKCGCDTLTK